MQDPRQWMLETVAAEIVQRREEGFDTSSAEAEFSMESERWGPSELMAFLERLAGLGTVPGYPYTEPSDLDGIESESTGPSQRPLPVESSGLYDRILGAWLGRCAGCLLGKPVEGWGRAEIEDYLRLESAYPLDDYFPKPSQTRDRSPRSPGLAGEIDRMPRDDDIDYTILGLHLLEAHGLGITSEEIAIGLLSYLPYRTVFTAERVAYRNLVNLIGIPESAEHMNPYREWIGAQIRADPWAYVLPGRPVDSAMLAFRDARISHVKNGIYGAMMTAAMVSSAFSLGEPEKIVEQGLRVIPAKSRLHEAVERVLDWHDSRAEWEDCWELVEAQYGSLSKVHTIINALNVILGVLYGQGDFTRTISIAVMCGRDTDCNGATSGSILGAMIGTDGIPSRWTDPLNDTVESYVIGYSCSRISDLADRTHRLAKEAL